MANYKYPDKNIDSVADLLGKIKSHDNEKIWFRGQVSSAWNLRPGIGRDDFSDKDLPIFERELMDKFRQLAPVFLDRKPIYEWDWLFLMQHNNMPTRLLDWTENPLIALYLALVDLKDKDDKSGDGALWCLLPEKLNEIAGVGARLPLLGKQFSEPADVMDQYLPSKDLPADPLLPIAGLAERSFDKMQVQSSVFTISSNPKQPLNLTAPACIWRYIIPENIKGELEIDLRLLKVTEHTLFPRLDTIRDSILGG